FVPCPKLPEEFQKHSPTVPKGLETCKVLVQNLLRLAYLEAAKEPMASAMHYEDPMQQLFLPVSAGSGGLPLPTASVGALLPTSSKN
ncbi:unnamed protein product, partial [Amoebophrya sp. A120]